jgi:hypothetical protein
MSPRSIKHTPLAITVPLPDGWEQEVEDGNTDVFWNEPEGPGTLRVAVLVYQAPEPVTDEDLQAVLTEDDDELQPAATPDGGYLAVSQDDDEEEGVSIHNWLWTLTKRGPENQVAVIVCTYTIENELIPTPEAESELQIVEQAVRGIRVTDE